MSQKIIILLLLAGITFCASCAEKEVVDVYDNAGLEPVAGDTLVRLLPAEPDLLNPVLSTDTYASIIEALIFDSLIERNPETLAFRPLCAEKWEVSADGLEYTFYLRKDIKWQDGLPMTAHDVKFSFDRIKDPSVNAPHLRNYYEDIEKLEVMDDYTVKFTYNKKYFRALEICGTMSILPEHLYGKSPFNNSRLNRMPVGNGPYRFLQWNTGRDIVLERNKEYWGKKPYIEKIVFKIITDNTVALQLLKKREIDLMILTALQWESQTSSEKFNSRFSKLKYYVSGYSYIGWNIRNPLFADKRVRIAMTHFIDRKKILEKLLYNLGTVVTGNFYVNSPEYNKNINPYEYNPQKAGELLRDAGWKDTDGDGILDKDGRKFEFEFLIPSGNDFREKLATIIKEDLAVQGINVEIKKLEWAVFIQNLSERDFDATSLGWSMPLEADPYQVWHSSQAEQGSNFVGFKNKRADELILLIRETLEKEKRIEYCHEFHEIIHKEQPYTFLFCSESLVALDKRFMNVKVYPLGIRPIEWYVPEELQKY